MTKTSYSFVGDRKIEDFIDACNWDNQLYADWGEVVGTEETLGSVRKKLLKVSYLIFLLLISPFYYNFCNIVTHSFHTDMFVCLIYVINYTKDVAR